MRLRFVLCCLSLLVTLPSRAAIGDEVWAALRQGGAIVLMRHAQTEPGIGDPAGFTLGRCDTQRNLSAAGRADARAIGEQFRARKIVVDEVLASHWCRAQDTARLAFGKVTPATMLDSMFKDKVASDDDAKVAALFAHLAARGKGGPGNIVLVTHAVNIMELTGVSPASGELVVARLAGPRSLKVVARGAP
jgi:phosphohistidine phosphatase SixA